MILEQVGDTGVMYRTQPERGGHEQTLHRSAMKVFTALPVEVPPPATELQGLKYPHHLDFMDFCLRTVTGSLLDELENALRRSAWTNLGKPLA